MNPHSSAKQKKRKNVFLLDGYNIIYSPDWDRRQSSEKNRHSLYTLTQQIAASEKAQACIFFDGPDPLDLMESGAVRVVYANEATADALLCEKAAKLGPRACAVTYDREIITFCRERAIPTMTPKAYLNLLPAVLEKPAQTSPLEVTILTRLFKGAKEF